MTALLKYDAACRAIAEAKSIDEVSGWVDKAAAVREYGRRIKNRQIEIDAIEIRVRARRRRGELLRELEKAGHLRPGPEKVIDQGPIERVTLADLGISKNESSEDQKIAAIDGNSFERLVARCRAYTETHPEKHTFDVLKPPPEGPINGARAIMGSRQEPDDSLDYFPTPPWATRALIECVFGQKLSWPVDFFKGRSVWEPAAGEGHIAEVLSEYFGEVVESDIHDYGRPDAHIVDFLTCEHVNRQDDVDWIITNPPFKEKTEQFLFQAIKQARTGVAFFVRMQWLETKGRYERIFRDNPPTIIAFFSERVPLCKGEWKPNGDTATAYVWLIWIKRHDPLPPFWIPPTCRDELTFADDIERFTQHPVKRIVRSADDGTPCDPDTGEITETEAEERAVDIQGASEPEDHDGDHPKAGDIPDLANAASPAPAEDRAPCVVAAGALNDGLDIPDYLRR